MTRKPSDIELIASFTDFGSTGPYQGQMDAVLALLAPKTPKVTLMTDAPMFDAQAAGLLLSALCINMPPHTLYLAIVDPGVGSRRRALMVQTERSRFVGPDNGLFVPVVKKSHACEIAAIEWRPERLSESFHGRDLFAPVAAKLANGEEVEASPLHVEEMVGFDSLIDRNQIIYLDHFGNAMTGLDAETIDEGTVVSVNGHALRHARTFSEVPAGDPFWYRNSIGLIELAVNCGSAAGLLDLALGMSFELLHDAR